MPDQINFFQDESPPPSETDQFPLKKDLSWMRQVHKVFRCLAGGEIGLAPLTAAA
jgi:hypothetical protein